MTSAISFGVQGYDRAEATVSAAAAQIANFSSAQPGSAGAATIAPDSADLSATAVSLIQGKDSAQASLATIHVAEQMQKSLIDLLG